MKAALTRFIKTVTVMTLMNATLATTVIPTPNVSTNQVTYHHIRMAIPANVMMGTPVADGIPTAVSMSTNVLTVHTLMDVTRKLTAQTQLEAILAHVSQDTEVMVTQMELVVKVSETFKFCFFNNYYIDIDECAEECGCCRGWLYWVSMCKQANV